MEDSPCMACGHLSLEPWLSDCEDFYLHTPHRVNYGICSQCKLVQQVPRVDSTSSFYPSDYPMHHSRGAFFNLARKLLIHGVYYRPKADSAPKTLLDFGCGDGSYLASIEGKVARRLGFEASPPVARSVEESLGCPVFSDVSQAEMALAGEVDIITAHFVLEHLTDLDGTFRFWRGILKKGGQVHLAVPNIHAWEARLFGRKWHGLDAPRHISFPCGDTLDLLAKRHGFSIVGRRWGIFPNTWAASLVTVLAGGFRPWLFVPLVPVGFLLALMFPQSTSVYQLKKIN